MTEIRRNEIITELAESLQDREYDRFIKCCEENAVLEIPFMADGGVVHKGLPEIKKHFENVAADSMTNLIRIEEIMAKTYHNEEVATVEFFTKGRLISTGETFHIPSAVAIIRFGETGIVHYKDIPNTICIAKKAGVLNQLLDSWKEK